MTSSDAMSINCSKNIIAFPGIDTLKSGSKMMIYCATISSHRYCIEAERGMLIARLDANSV